VGRCKKCGTEGYLFDGMCTSCATIFGRRVQTPSYRTDAGQPHGVASATASSRADATMRRYQDAYRVAGTIVAVGRIIKGIGLALATVILLVFVSIGGGLPSQGGATSLLPLWAGVVVAGMTGLFFWLLGVLVSSQGQVILASLDGAVNSSPFLSDDQRADAMSIG
jgi:hypothetical protein